MIRFPSGVALDVSPETLARLLACAEIGLDGVDDSIATMLGWNDADVADAESTLKTLRAAYPIGSR